MDEYLEREVKKGNTRNVFEDGIEKPTNLCQDWRKLEEMLRHLEERSTALAAEEAERK